MKFSTRYEQRGSSADKEELHKALSNTDKGLFPQAFCKILKDYLGNDAAYCNIIHADGAGTKSSLAYIYWKETQDQSVWQGIAQDAIVMNTDDLLCVGATGPMILSSCIARNKKRIPGEVITKLIQGTENVLTQLCEHGLTIVSGGGETADLGDLTQTLIVDSTITCRMKRSDVINNANIRAGDVIIGLASAGQASYETEYNSGIGSNGLTSARHDVLHHSLGSKYPESFDAQIPKELCYAGSKKLKDLMDIPGFGEISVGKLLLSPTRTFAPILLKILEKHRTEIHGIVHLSGGAQTKVLNFVKALHIVKHNLFAAPPIFELIQAESKTPWQEMYQTFNMGHRMELYVPENIADSLIKISESFSVAAQRIGRVKSLQEDLSGKSKLSIHSKFGKFEYLR